SSRRTRSRIKAQREALSPRKAGVAHGTAIALSALSTVPALPGVSALSAFSRRADDTGLRTSSTWRLSRSTPADGITACRVPAAAHGHGIATAADGCASAAGRAAAAAGPLYGQINFTRAIPGRTFRHWPPYCSGGGGRSQFGRGIGRAAIQ